MPELELHYFAGKGRGEAIRLTLHVGGVPFDNVHFDGFQDFASQKAEGKLVYAQAPVLYVDGAQYAQTSALTRYCATLAGLLPESGTERLAADEYACAMDELFAKLPGSLPDAELRAAREKFCKLDVPRILGGMERAVLIRGAGDESSPWLVGGNLSYVDLAAYAVLGLLKHAKFDHVPTEIVDDYPRLMRAWKAMDEHPKVVEWIKEHPWKT